MRGRLLSLLRAAKTATNNSHNGAMGQRNFAPLSPRRLTGFAHDIARGMEYISEKKVKKTTRNYQSHHIAHGTPTVFGTSFRLYIVILLPEMCCSIIMAFAKYAILECPLIWRNRNRPNRTHEKLISYDNKAVPNRIDSGSISIDDHSAMIEKLTIASNDLLYRFGGWHRRHCNITSFRRKPICGRTESFVGK